MLRIVAWVGDRAWTKGNNALIAALLC